MTVLAVLLDPPRPGLVLQDVYNTTPLTPEEAAMLYAAMAKDTVRAVAESGGELLVNYRTEADIPEQYRADKSVKEEISALVSQAIDDPDIARFEKQVGSSFASRVGNTVTHLLTEEDADSVGVLDGKSPTIVRQTLDSAAMKVRQHDTVIAPGINGDWSYLAFTEPIDFTGIFAPPALVTIVHEIIDQDYSVDFLPIHPHITDETNLIMLVTLMKARAAANKITPPFTRDALDRFDLQLAITNGQYKLERNPT